MSFRLKSAVFGTRLLKLSVENARQGVNHFTVIVGKNGIGKSRLLRAITETFKAFDRDGRLPRPGRNVNNYPQHEFRLTYESHGSTIELAQDGRRVFSSGHADPDLQLSQLPKPSAVIATSVSPFDKFPLDRNSLFLRQNIQPVIPTLYRYLGTKNQVGQRSGTALLSRVIESLFKASEKDYQDVLRLNNVFEFLQYSPRVQVEYELLIDKAQLKDLLNTYPKDEFIFGLLKKSRSGFYPDPKTLLEREPNLASRLIQASHRLLSQPFIDNRRLKFDLDFGQGGFLQGSLEIYNDLTLFRRCRLARLHHFYLLNRDLQSINFSDASSGEQCVVLTLLGIASEISNDSLVCIDEPEISLHPEWQEKFIELLMATFSNYSGCHFVLATHSPQILSRIEGAEGSVLTMDDGSLHSATEFSGKSSDYQLVEAFRAPGLRNEFLSRIGLAVLTRLSTTGQIEAAYQKHYETLLDARPMLEDDDPVAKLIDGITNAVRGDNV